MMTVISCIVHRINFFWEIRANISEHKKEKGVNSVDAVLLFICKDGYLRIYHGAKEWEREKGECVHIYTLLNDSVMWNED